MPTSDDFRNGIDSGLWTTVTPSNTYVSANDDAVDWWAEIATTNGTSHDHYSNDTTIPYIYQSVSSADYDIRVKFLSTPTINYEGMGLMFMDVANGYYLRFDFNATSGGNFFAFASYSNGTSGSTRISTSQGAFGSTWYPYMRVVRSGNTWYLYRSSDGSAWTQVGPSFSQTFSVTGIAIVTNSSGSSTGFVGKYDWFEDYTNDPISGEDSGGGTNIDMPAGAVTVAGYATTETESVLLPMGVGAAVVAGHATTETENVLLPMDAGAAVIAGHATTETESVLLPMDAGAAVVAGYATTEIESVLLPMDAGAATVAGHDFALTASVPVAMDAGAVVVAGHATTETESVLLPMDAGAATVAGHATTETESLVIAMDAGTLVVAGYDISLTDETSIAMDAGSVTVAGYSTTETENFVIAMAEAAVVVAGHDFTVGSSASIAMDAGAVTVAGYATTEVSGAFVAMDAGAAVVAGYDTTEASTANILMGAGVVTVTGYDTLDGIDLSPAPRLPRDDTEVLAGEAFGLGFMVSYAPVTGPFHLSLLQTRTPKHWVAPLDRQVYNWNLTNNFNSFAEAEAEAEPVLEEFAKDNPKPPQNRGVTT
jgi:stress response protein YsnF